MSNIINIVNDMTNYQIIESKLLDLGIDTYEYLTSEELHNETDEILLLFLFLSSKRVDIAIEEDDKIDVLIDVINIRLKQIIKILGIDEGQILNSLNYVNEIILEILFNFFYSLNDKSIFYKIIEYIMDMNEDNNNLSICIQLLNIIDYDNETIFRIIINHENWIQLKDILDSMIIDNDYFLDII